MQNTKLTPQEQILSIVLGFWQARALAVATELGLADLLAEGPLHVDELASRIKTNGSALFRLLRDYYISAGDEVARLITGGVLAGSIAVKTGLKEFAAIGADEVILNPTLDDLDEIERLASVVL